MKKVLTLAVVTWFYAPCAFSWGEMGHATVGEIAERNLTPEIKTAINDILGPEKLALTAVWADSVKDDSDFDPFKPYHFMHSDVAESDKDSMTVLKKYPEILKDKNANRSVKIVALKYLVHVVGDIHQPFHVGLVGDAGGNFCKVSWKPGQLSNLHAVWDGKVIEYDVAQFRKNYSPFKDYSYNDYASDIIKTQKLSEEELTGTQNDLFSSWAKESEVIRDAQYLGSAPYTYCQKNSTEIPTVTDEYKKQAAEVTEKRLLQAGLRLANLLNSIFKHGTNPGVNASMTKEEVLKALELTN